MIDTSFRETAFLIYFNYEFTAKQSGEQLLNMLVLAPLSPGRLAAAEW
jgi:hypothetical protein